jgi:hypothetical protein
MKRSDQTMPTVADSKRFTRALIAYFGDDSSPGYSPTAALDGDARVRAEFPKHAADLSAEIDQMFEFRTCLTKPP